MQQTIRLPARLLAVIVALASTLIAEEQPHIRFRGEGGSGFFPACTPVTSWSEYSYEERREGRIKWDEPVDERQQHIVWKKSLPMWGNAQPIAVGGKLYVLHEMPYWDEQAMGPSLVCLDAASGKELWRREIHHLGLLSSDKQRELAQLWLEERQWVASKWRLAWRMHLVDSGDQDAIRKIWEEAVALGVTSRDDKNYGQKLGDHKMGDTGRFWKGESKERKQRMQALDAANLFHTAWSELSANVPGRWMGETFATPVSDGSFLYIRTARHVLTCCDLDGEIRWQTIYTDARGYCDFAPSPILVDDLLILFSSANRGSDDVICRGIDKTNGRLRWQLPGKAAPYALGTPVTLTLASGREVVFLASGHVIDPRDGKVLCEVPCHLAGADNPVAQGDVVFMRNSQEGGGYGGKDRGIPAGLQAVRLQESGNSVTAEILWRQADDDDGFRSSQGQAITASLLFSNCNSGVAVLDPASGAVIKTQRCRSNCWNLAIAGGYLFVGDQRNAQITVLSADRELNVLSEQQIGQPKKIPADMWHYRNEKSNWGVVGKPFPMFFSGNRIYLRTWYDVYCLGDPGQQTTLSPRHR